MYFRRSAGSGITGNETLGFLFVYSVFRCYSLLRKL